MSNKEKALELMRYIDLTSLKSTDTHYSIEKWCNEINEMYAQNPDLPLIPAVCVYPCYVETVAKTLQNKNIKIASVSTGFPEGQTFEEIRFLETKMAIEAGANEIDMVLRRGYFLAGEHNASMREILKVKLICGNTPLKVILETSELGSQKNIREASLLALRSDADFIKTSTGKSTSGASLEAFSTMCKAIKQHESETGEKRGIKASGGISTLEQAWQYRELVRTLLGTDYLNPRHFRIGASSLLKDLLTHIAAS